MYARHVNTLGNILVAERKHYAAHFGYLVAKAGLTSFPVQFSHIAKHHYFVAKGRCLSTQLYRVPVARTKIMRRHQEGNSGTQAERARRGNTAPWR